MSDTERINKNVRAYLVSRVAWLGIMVPGIVQLWQKDGLSFSQVLLLQGLFALFLVLMEFPTGVLADLMERRQVIIFGHVMILVGSLVYSVVHGFNGFLFAELFYSVGMASISGADTASLWDSFLEEDSELSVNETIAAGRSIMMGSAAILTITGGVIASYNLVIPFYLAAIGSLLNIVAYYQSSEPSRIKVKDAKTAWIESFRLFNEKEFIEVLLLFFMMSVILRVVFWAYIPKLQKYDVNPLWFGFVLAGANLVAVISTLYLKRNPNPTNTVIFITLILSGLGAFIFAIDDSLIIVLVAIMLHQIGRGIIGVITPIKINEVAKSEIRASAGSFLSMLGGLVYFGVTFGTDLLNLSMNEIMVFNTVLFIFILGIWIGLSLEKHTQVDLPMKSTI